MKITRAYLLGVGSGLMLSLLLALSLPALGLQDFSQLNNFFKDPENPTVLSTASTIKPMTTPSSPATPPTSNPTNPVTVTGVIQPLEKQFIIPNRVSSERIAELLVGQGFVTNKAKFMETVEKRGVAGKFQSGTYNLIPGLNHNEVINRLISK
ncbi:MAG: hypothetical protein ACYDEJ_02350 [Desulfitobacteriaceae bacterium]